MSEMKTNKAYSYLVESGLVSGNVKLIYIGTDYFTYTDSVNEFTFNAAGVLVATNEG